MSTNYVSLGKEISDLQLSELSNTSTDVIDDKCKLQRRFFTDCMKSVADTETLAKKCLEARYQLDLCITNLMK